MPKVVFVNEKKEIEVSEGANLREEALKAGIQVYSGINRFLNCMGNATCGTCAVLVNKGAENLNPPGWLERLTLGRMLLTIGREKETRLSCQCVVKGDCTIVTKPALQLAPEPDAKGKQFWETPWPNK